MDEDVNGAAQLVQQEWEYAIATINDKIRALDVCSSSGTCDEAALPRLSAAVQACLLALQHLILRFEFIAQQLPSEEESETCLQIVQQWKEQYKA